MIQDQRQALFHHLADLKPDPGQVDSDGKSQNKNSTVRSDHGLFQNLTKKLKILKFMSKISCLH